jgi:acyl-coenzyme A thioesterase PaaI-like protein
MAALGLEDLQMKFPMMVAAAAIALSSSAGAVPFTVGTPISTMPPPVVGLGGDVKAVFMFYSAADKDTMEISMPILQSLFTNKTTPVGTTVDLGNLSGPLQWSLTDVTLGRIYLSDTPDGHGYYHAVSSTNFLDFGVGPLSSTAAAALVGLPNITFVSWEDHGCQSLPTSTSCPGVDWDYNDLIFAVSVADAQHNPGVPEPLTLSLVGMGLLGAFGLRRSKKA